MDSSLPTVFVFAYGSNMLTQRIRERCPTAEPIGVASFTGHALRWHKRSTDGSGKCNVIKSAAGGAVVFGVLFRIAEVEASLLDVAEGLGQGYEKTMVSVRCNGDSIRAFIYTATRIDDSLKPYTWYKALVVAGAQQHGLPAEYISRLEATVATQDPDRARHERKMAMINDTPGTAK